MKALILAFASALMVLQGAAAEDCGHLLSRVKIGTPLVTSPDGSVEIIYDGDSNGIYAREAGTRKLISKPPYQFSGLFLERFSADGSRLMIGSRDFLDKLDPILKHAQDATANSGVRVIDIASGRIVATYLGGGTSSEISADGKTAAIGGYGIRGFTLYDVDSGKVVGKLTGESLQFSSNSRQVLTSGYASSTIVDIRTGAVARRFFDRGRVKLSANGERVWFVNGRDVTERNSVTGQITLSYKLPRGANQYTNSGVVVKESADGRIATVSFDQQNQGTGGERTLLLNRESGKSAILPFGYFYNTRISNDGAFIVVNDVTQLAVYDTKTMEQIFSFKPDQYFLNMIKSATFAIVGNQRALIIHREKDDLIIKLERD